MPLRMATLGWFQLFSSVPSSTSVRSKRHTPPVRW
jgi:hypothetical protein